jgi:type III restriction enzyme
VWSPAVRGHPPRHPIFFRGVEDHWNGATALPDQLCDIYEPHALAYEDSVGKTKGLAEFARDHGEKLGRIQLIAELKRGSFKRLCLDDTEVRDKVLGVVSAEHLRQLVEQAE